MNKKLFSGLAAASLSIILALPAVAQTIIFEDNAVNNYQFLESTGGDAGGGDSQISGGGANTDGSFGGRQKWCNNTTNYETSEDGRCYRWDGQEWYNSIAIDATLFTGLELCAENASRKVDTNEALIYSYSLSISPGNGGNEIGRVAGGGNGNTQLGTSCFNIPAAAEGGIFYLGIYNNSSDRNERFYSGPITITGTLINLPGSVAIDNQDPSSGTALTASVSDGNNISATISYSWDGAGSQTDQATYTVVPADAGNQITVTASYTDDDGYSNTASDTTNAVAVNNAGSIAAISGTLTEGDTLTAGTVSDADGVGTLTYQWQSNGTNTGSDQDTYITQFSDVDNTITVTVSYTDNLGFPESVTSAGVGPIIAAFTNTVATISIDNDSPTVGSTLTASIDDIDGVPADVTYVWTSASGGQSGLSNTYDVVEGDVFSTIRVEVAFTDDEGTDETASATTANAVPLGNSPASVSISGNAVVNSPVTAEITDADGYTNPSLNDAIFTWTLDGVDQANGNNCSAATCFPSAEGELLVAVSYTDNNGFTEDITSAAVTVEAQGSGNGGGGGGTNPPAAPTTGCNYNPMARSFDMLFILMAGAGFLYLRSRRRQTIEALDA
jgi:hypothetical protein